MSRLFSILLLSCILFVYPVYSSNSLNKVYFDKCAEKAVIDLIMSAKSTINIQMYNFTNYKPVIDALKFAICKGVKIRCFIDDEGTNNPLKEDGTGFPEPELEKYKCDKSQGKLEVRWDKKNSIIMHRKLAVIDHCYVWLGSTNWTKSGFMENDEVDILLEDSEIASILEGQFEVDWSNANKEYKDNQTQPNP